MDNLHIIYADAFKIIITNLRIYLRLHLRKSAGNI